MTDQPFAFLGRLRRALQPGSADPHSAAPYPAVPLTAGPLTAGPRTPVLTGSPVFTADFSSKAQWVAGRSWAYPDGGPTNPGDNKLDHLVPDPSYSRTGVFHATRRPEGTWSAGLLTTEGSEQDFTVRTGDVLEARVRLPAETGAWPGIWTWWEGGNEIDVFEYHPDNPDVLELSNHVNGGGHYYTDPAIHPGAWVDLRVEFGAGSVTWWVNGDFAFADGTGVGPDWCAHLIVNLSACAGEHHPAPDPAATAMSYEVSELRVHRPT